MVPTSLRAVLGVGVFVLLSHGVRAEEPAEKLSNLDISRTTVARDLSGRTLTLDAEGRSIQVWSARGTLDKTCTFDSTQAYTAGYIGLNDTRALFAAAAGDHSTLSVYDSSSCRLLRTADLNDMAVFAVSPARDGWLVRARRLKDEHATVLRVDTEARITDHYDMPRDVLDDKTSPEAQGRIEQALEVDGDVWLVPGDTYALVRPAQHGHPTYVFQPPACLGSKDRKLSQEEATTYREQMAKQFSGTGLGTVIVKAPSQLEVRLAPLAGIASYRSLIGAMVRPPDSPSCRLDIWDLVDEKLVLSRTLPSCPVTFWFDDETLTLRGDTRLYEESLAQPLYNIKRQDPCELAGITKKPAKPSHDTPSSTQATKADLTTPASADGPHENNPRPETTPATGDARP